jgi:hypothetical protein
VFPLALPIAIIDFIAVFFYIRKQHPQGIAGVIGYTVFIAVSFVLTYVAWSVILLWLLGRIVGSDFSFIVSPPFSAVIAIDATVLIVLFLRPKFRK